MAHPPLLFAHFLLCFGLLKIQTVSGRGLLAAFIKVGMAKTVPDLSASSLQHSSSNVISAHHCECPQTLRVLSCHGLMAPNTGAPFYVTKTPLWCSQKPETEKMHNNCVIGPAKTTWDSEEVQGYVLWMRPVCS